MPQTIQTLGPDRIGNPSLLRLLELWCAKRGGRTFPARADFDPVELKFLLGSILILDVLPGPSFRFRLHGSKLTGIAGYDMTGKDIDELPSIENRRNLVRRCCSLIADPKPMAIRMARPLGSRRFNYEALWLPLATDGSSVDMLMCGLVYLDDWEHAQPEHPAAGLAPTGS